MWNFGYHLARARGAAVRRIFRASIPSIVSRRLTAPRKLDFEVFSYSSEEMLPEQVASARSFLKFAGEPTTFSIVSDGSHSVRSISLLQKIHPRIRVARAEEFLPRDAPAAMHDYLAHHPTGKQLALLMSLPRDQPALYFDSDVLFFPGASALASLPPETLYLSDAQFAGDERLLRDQTEKSNPVNTGVLFLVRSLDWSLAFDRFAELKGAPNFFTNQTLTHLVLHANRAQPFDPARFILKLDDQFIFRDLYASPEIVLRHYVNPVRYKFWCARAP